MGREAEGCLIQLQGIRELHAVLWEHQNISSYTYRSYTKEQGKLALLSTRKGSFRYRGRKLGRTDSGALPVDHSEDLNHQEQSSGVVLCTRFRHRDQYLRARRALNSELDY